MAETIGSAILKAAFGECNVKEDEKVRIYIDGVLTDVPFSIGLRTVWRQTFGILGSFIRLFMFDPMNDWCFTPEERRVRYNKQAIKDFLRGKVAQYSAWRETNKIKTGDMITIADVFKAHFDDEEVQLEEFVSALFGFAQTTMSATI